MTETADDIAARGGGPERAAPSPPPRGAMGRTLKNAGWLLGGKGVGGLFSLVYLGLAARALGVERFGEFALILSFGQAVASIAQFQTAEIVIRYGAAHLAEARHDRFARLLGLAAALDLASAVACAAIAASLAFLLGGAFGLDEGDRWRTAIFGASFLFSLRGAPVGVLRLLDRFDVAALSETALPATRLAAALACFYFMPTVDAFLIAWASAELLTTAATWFAALRQLRRRRIAMAGFPFALRGVGRENPDIWRFAWFTNVTSSISFLWQHAGTLAVGWVSGPAAAGGFRVAMQLAHSLSKPVVSLSRAVFPEFARIAIHDGGRAVGRFLSRLSVIAGVSGLLAVLIVALAGEWILTLIVGEEFAFAAPLLLLLTISAAIDFWGFGQEPALLTLGKPGAVLGIRAATGLLYVGALAALLLAYGPAGAAVAAIVGRLIQRGAMAAFLARASR